MQLLVRGARWLSTSNAGSGNPTSSAATGSTPASASTASGSNASSTGKASLNLMAAAEAAGFSSKASDELLGRLKDPSLLHTAALIGGKWIQTASSAATFQARSEPIFSHEALQPIFFSNAGEESC